MRKNYFAIVIVFCACLLFFGSCQKENFLDKTESTDLKEATVFADSAYTMDFLTGIYTDVGFSTSPTRFGGGGLDASSDEAEGSSSGSINTYIQFATGTVNPSIINSDSWSVPYANIRRVNKLLQHLPAVKFSIPLKARVKAEARFLRAWYYSILLRHYGGVPILRDSIYNSADSVPTVRNTYEECVNYIVKECNEVAPDLPWIQDGPEYGRVNKAACLALKARVLLYAASPLFNGGGLATTEPLKPVVAYPSFDKERWKLAQDAALEVINPGQYSLVLDNTTEPGFGFYKLFTLRKSSELIFARMQGPNYQLESVWLPPTHGVSNPAAYPYLETVNAFGMKNGKAIDAVGSGYDEHDPYKDRDPRLINSFVRDQSLVYHVPELDRIPVNIFIDKTDPNKTVSGQNAIYKGTPTGYYTYKMVTRDVVSNWFNTKSSRCFPLIRYAEVLLDYAEARNEYLDEPDLEVYKAVEAIRERAGLVPFTLEAGLSRDKMREIIHNERRKELAFEGHRFFDVRRWKIADVTENKMMHGTEPVKTASGTIYNTIEVRKHNFSDKMYLWPIPESEIKKSPDLMQNPGY